MPYRPPGGMDWNKNGTYDWSDRLKDFRAYEIITGNKHPLDPDSKKESVPKPHTTSSYSYRVSNAKTQVPKRKLHYHDIITSSYYDERPIHERYVNDLITDLKREFDQYSELENATLDQKKEFLRKGPVILDKFYLPWEYIAKNPDKGYEIAGLHIEMSHKYCDLLSDVLKTAPEKSYAQRNIYLKSCKWCISLCNSSKKILSNTSFFKSLLDEVLPTAAGNRNLTEELILATNGLDRPYKIIAGMQIICVERIMDCLNPELFLNSPSLQEELVEVAIAFDQMWYSFVKRFFDFYLCPSDGIIDINWDSYQSILKGLPHKVIDTLDESSWKFLFKRMEDNNMKESADKFKKKFADEREAKREAELASAKERFTKEKPNICKKMQKLEMLLVKKEKVLEEEQSTMKKLEQQMHHLDETMSLLQGKIQNNNNSKNKLSKKFFGKRKAEQNITALEAEITDLKNQYDLAAAELQNVKQLYRHQKNRVDEQKQRVLESRKQLTVLKESNDFPE